MRVLVMGGTRFVGVATVRALLRHGHDVTLFHRGTRTVTWHSPVRNVLGDRTVADDLRPLRRLGIDAVVDLSAYTRAQTELLLDALPDVAHLVHASTVNVYAPSPLLPWPEDTPYGPHPLWGRYAVDKIGCELALRARRTAPLSTVALRFPLVLGPRNFIPREEFVLNRILDGEEILLPGDGQAVHQYVYVDHAAEALARSVTLAAPGFTAFNVASPRCVTSLQGFAEVCADVAATPAIIRTVGGGPTGLDLAQFDTRDCVFPFTNENTVADLDAARGAGLIAPFLDLHQMIETALTALTDEPSRRRWNRTAAELQILERRGSTR
jgi:2'-hydroxyisoflavone reductase